MEKFYEGIVMRDVVTMWLPIVVWTYRQGRRFFKWRNYIPWYSLTYFSPLAGLQFIQEEWGYNGVPLVVVMSPRGDVLSKHELDEFPTMKDLRKEEKAVACRTKLLLQTPLGDITEVLEALFQEDTLWLTNGGRTLKKAEISFLRDKYVVLFILDEDYDIDQIEAVYAGINRELVELVLIPMGRKGSAELLRDLRGSSSRIKCYTVLSHLRRGGINFIRDHWYFQNSPIVIMMNPQGEVLSEHKFNPPPPKEVYSLCWEGPYDWNERFSRIAKAVAADKVLKKANISIDLPSNNDNPKEDGRRKWAQLTRNQDHTTVCEGPKIVNVLEAFSNWKENLTRAPFEICFKDYFYELLLD